MFKISRRPVIATMLAIALVLAGAGFLWQANIVHTSADDGQKKCNGVNVEDARGPENDSMWNWNEGDINIPCDPTIYLVTGRVTGNIASITKQISAGGGSISGSAFAGTGFMSGSFFGPEFGGKGVVRVTVMDASAGIEDLAPLGQVILLKTSDIKAVGLTDGDQVTFKCRKEYEAVAAIIPEEKFTEQHIDAAGTYELDYCRLVSPIVGNLTS